MSDAKKLIAVEDIKPLMFIVAPDWHWDNGKVKGVVEVQRVSDWPYDVTRYQVTCADPALEYGGRYICLQLAPGSMVEFVGDSTHLNRQQQLQMIAEWHAANQTA